MKRFCRAEKITHIVLFIIGIAFIGAGIYKLANGATGLGAAVFFVIGFLVCVMLNMFVVFGFALHHNIKNYNTHSSEIDDELKAAKREGRDPEPVISDNLNDKIENLINL